MPHLRTYTSKIQECIENCTDCSNACMETVNHCLRLGGKHSQGEHIQLLGVCSEICRTSANAMLLESHFHKRICEVCAEICEACAVECDSMGDDETMRDCAEACRRCAESCKSMATYRVTRLDKIG